MKFAVPVALAAALTMTASAALAGPIGAVENLGKDIGHRAAQTGRAVGHEGADIGRDAGHAVAQTGRDITGDGPHHRRVRHHRRHHAR